MSVSNYAYGVVYYFDRRLPLKVCNHSDPYRTSYSSCPQWTSPPPVCDQSALNSPDANPHVLYGALVGGPDQNGNYNPNRKEFASNEVSVYNNAGFQSAVAGMLHSFLSAL